MELVKMMSRAMVKADAEAPERCSKVVCPYCGNDSVGSDTRVCCGEPHGIDCCESDPCEEHRS